MTDNPAHAMVLSGGGVFAAYEVGVMRSLFEGRSPASKGVPIDPHIFAGTSAGAFNAAVLVSQPDRPVRDAAIWLEQLWRTQLAGSMASNGVLRLRLNPLHWVAPPQMWPARMVEAASDALHLSLEFMERTRHTLTSGHPYTQSLLEWIDLAAFVNPSPFDRVIRRFISPEAIGRSNRIIWVAATNWSTGALELFGNQHMATEWAARIIEASTALPGFFSPVRMGSSYYVDGGVLMNTPLKPAIDAGASVIHATYMDPDPASIPVENIQSLVGSLDRTMSIAFANRVTQDIERARRINQGIALAQNKLSGATDDERVAIEALLSIRRKREQNHKYRRLTIHRYSPTADLGDLTAILDLNLKTVDALIAQGDHDAVHHDCERAGCVLPG